MKGEMRYSGGKRHSNISLFSTSALLISLCIKQVVSLPTDAASNNWPTFPRRNIASLAREGYLKNANSFKRSISILAKNGQLPTFRSPYDANDKQDQDDEAQVKRNVASIARMRSFEALKRNVQALARDGYRGGRSQHNPQNDKRNLASLARNGLVIHKRDESGNEYYYPFYQNSIPPLSELDEPIDINEFYDYQQSVNPDMFPPLSQVFKRDGQESSFLSEYSDGDGIENNWYLKRGTLGLPVHGLFRPQYVEPNQRSKRYILTLPDEINSNDVQDNKHDDNNNDDKRSVDDNIYENFEKRHIGSLARLGLLPSFRFSGGRYSRSGRARLLLPSQEMYRKHSADENFGIREYLTNSEAESAINSNDPDVSTAPVLAHSHPTGRILNRMNNDVPSAAVPLLSPPNYLQNYIEPMTKNTWQPNCKESPRFHYFRSLKVPCHSTGKRYPLIPTVDNILLRKGYRNSSLPSRRKNQ